MQPSHTQHATLCPGRTLHYVQVVRHTMYRSYVWTSRPSRAWRPPRSTSALWSSICSRSSARCDAHTRRRHRHWHQHRHRHRHQHQHQPQPQPRPQLQSRARTRPPLQPWPRPWPRARASACAPPRGARSVRCLRSEARSSCASYASTSRRARSA